MKIVSLAVLVALSALAFACGDKPPQDPSTSTSTTPPSVDTDAAAPSTDPAAAPTSTN